MTPLTGIEPWTSREMRRSIWELLLFSLEDVMALFSLLVLCMLLGRVRVLGIRGRLSVCLVRWGEMRRDGMN